MTRSYSQWRFLADCYITWQVTDDQAERAVFLDKIATQCCALEREGEIASIKHAVHLVTGEPCNCVRCNPFAN